MRRLQFLESLLRIDCCNQDVEKTIVVPVLENVKYLDNVRKAMSANTLQGSVRTEASGS
jgi:hypothetical protein